MASGARTGKCAATARREEKSAGKGENAPGGTGEVAAREGESTSTNLGGSTAAHGSRGVLPEGEWERVGMSAASATSQEYRNDWLVTIMARLITHFCFSRQEKRLQTVVLEYTLSGS